RVLSQHRAQVLLDGTSHRNRAWLGGGWWLSAVELPVPGVPAGLGRRSTGPAAHTSQPRRLRKWRGLGASQRLTRPPRAAAPLTRTLSARQAAREPDQGDHADR